jgi:hypothetical protein
MSSPRGFRGAVFELILMHKKRKRISKQEVKERMEGEIIDQGESINDHSNS